MIFYFSGTGNSLYVAKSIKNNDEKIISIAKEIHKNKELYEFEIESEESITFVYPVYAWAPPEMVVDFVKKLKFKNYDDNYISTVVTCGEQVGNTVKYFEELLKSRGLTLSSGFSVVAPNNYIIIGDVDNEESKNQKLIQLDKSLEKINDVIINKQKNVFIIEKGKIPKITTNIINPLFNNYARSIKKFHANDNCIKCKICENICNGNCIKVDDKPVWSGNCTHCLACINYCPTKAIQYGKSTIKKGRYKNPNIEVI